jgi:hypothetical protein
MFTMKSLVVGGPSVVSDGLVQSVGDEIRGRRCFTISELSELLCEFPQISRNNSGRAHRRQTTSLSIEAVITLRSKLKLQDKTFVRNNS